MKTTEMIDEVVPLSRRSACQLLLAAPLVGRAKAGHRTLGLSEGPTQITLDLDDTSYRFAGRGGQWACAGIWVRGKQAAAAVSPTDSFFVGAGLASGYRVVTHADDKKEILFTGLGGDPARAISFRIDASDGLPRFFIEIRGVTEATCRWRTVEAAPDQRGAWATRGETATDAEGREVFVDGAGRLVFGHSRAGAIDVAYVVQAFPPERVGAGRGRSMQPTETFFKSGQLPAARQGHHGFWQVRLGPAQPKQFAIVFDRDLGGRLHDVCEKYYAAAVATQVDLASIPSNYDPYRAVELMPLRLSCPESLIPGYGWLMDEYAPGPGKRAAYPYGHEAGIQTGALLAYEGLATGRDWEKNFGKYVVDQMPLWGPTDGSGYFVKRPGGWTRWAYFSDYANKFPLQEGGNWTAAEHLYATAVQFGDDSLKQRALELMKHDVLVKLDRERMYFPPCWNPQNGKLGDHRDDWNTTAGLAYCAEISSQILYPETRDPQFLAIADAITDWLRNSWGPETRMNFLHPGVNTFHCFMGWLVRAMVHRHERGGESIYLEIAQDLAWIMMLTLCSTASRDRGGQYLTGVTCTGVRGCVDYDCTPNLCQEKDQAFLEMLGPLLDHVSGSGYATFLAMHKLVLPRDSWKAAFGVQEQRDLNLRTNYDNYPRGMTNLAFAVNRGSDPQVVIYEKLVSKRDLGIRRHRDMVLANGTGEPRTTRVQVRFLAAGDYRITLDGRQLGRKSSAELSVGVVIDLPPHALRSLQVVPVSAAVHRPAGALAVDGSVTFLSDLTETSSQRGVGLPAVTYQKDRDFRGNPLAIGGRRYDRGLGLAANTVIVYRLDGRYGALAATAAATASLGTGPAPSVNITLFVDGVCKFDSGALRTDSPPQQVQVDLLGAETLVIRVSGNWDDKGKIDQDLAVLADARLVGKTRA